MLRVDIVASSYIMSSPNTSFVLFDIVLIISCWIVIVESGAKVDWMHRAKFRTEKRSCWWAGNFIMEGPPELFACRGDFISFRPVVVNKLFELPSAIMKFISSSTKLSKFVKFNFLYKIGTGGLCGNQAIFNERKGPLHRACSAAFWSWVVALICWYVHSSCDFLQPASVL